MTGLVGEKLGHSFSVCIHAMLGDESYRNYEMQKEELASFFEKREFRGVNVTIPYKTAVIPLLDCVSEEARAIGAVNTVVNRDGKLYGYNTDFFGMRALFEKEGIGVEGKTVLVLGSGGTSKTAVAVARSLRANTVVVVSRHPQGEEIGYEEACTRFATEKVVLVNTTPVGMYPALGGSAIAPENFSNLVGVIDAVYNPLRTEFVLRAKNGGAKASGGLYMLVAQAVKSSELFFGREYPEDTVERIYAKLVKEKENTVLIGMPSCGKTTVGKLLAEATGRTLYDSDEILFGVYGKTPAEIISTEGEPAFRAKESAVLSALAGKTGCIIATGGGAVKDPRNVFALKQNGKLCFIDRSPENLLATPDRPLSSDRQALMRLYGERYPIYRASADVTVDGNLPAEAVVNALLLALENH